MNANDPDGEFLNFVAKFVVDVGIEVALQAVSGEDINLGAAAVSAATGLVNPAKTLQRGQKLAKAVKGTSAGKKVNLASDKRTNHILNGDETGGGHLAGTGKPGKSEFPSTMSGDDIMHTASDIATKPNPSGGRVIQGGRTVSRDTVDGVDIKVVDDGKDIITAHPTNTPRNPD